MTDLLGIENVFQQTNNENASGYLQKTANFYQDSKDVYEKLIKSKDEQIALLKNIIENQRK